MAGDLSFSEVKAIVFFERVEQFWDADIFCRDQKIDYITETCFEKNCIMLLEFGAIGPLINFCYEQNFQVTVYEVV